AVIQAKDYEEALAIANGSDFGLSAGIDTTTLKYATHFRRNAEAGMFMVNVRTAGVDFHVPFGGRQGSSFGPRELGRYAAGFLTVVKTAYTAAGLSPTPPLMSNGGCGPRFFAPIGVLSGGNGTLWGKRGSSLSHQPCL